ncbi:long-chain fatty acid--CoA ligase [Salicibibacter cibarius]|uniref:Long-chain fatty acid--CoA ligase n=1 Tax=Salicibibacter cibarius TaxID=2743000 RepID=A0A7T6Z549_9BACI|nr:long-chain fatty acid--CoA ligase [Salicibibacter cibarius]QQK76556.1 long-chain fatty acid--CoA ligase [Salicibibacter cibarius]
MSKVWLDHYPDHIKKEIEIPNKSLPQMLKASIANYGGNVALHFYGEEITYRELGELTDSFTTALQNAGVEKEDRVAIMLPNCPQFVVSFYGSLQAGAIATQINPMLVGKELQYILTNAGAETIVIHEPLLPVLDQIIGDTFIKNVIKVNLEGRDTDQDIAIGFNRFLESGGDLQPVRINANDDVAVLQYTGGTTGRSKGAMLTHRNLLANVLQAAEFFGDALEFGTDRFLTVIPLFHVYGMSNGMNLSIYTGGMNILLPQFDRKEALNVITDLRPTVFPGVPTMYINLISQPDLADYSLDSIRACISGSAPMPKEIMRTFEEKTSATVLEGYGLSETSPSTHGNPYFSRRKPGSVGIGLPSTDYKIVDLVNGEKEMAPSESGEIIIKGPQVMKGYWNMPEETAHALRDGWLYTGDIAYMDEDGYLYIVDRKKDLIIASGYNIYPRDVEEILYEHPAVQEAVVVGVPDAYRGETVKAVIVLNGDHQSSEEALIAYCRENMAAYKVPRVIEFREELPKTNVGKILRRKVREEAQ